MFIELHILQNFAPSCLNRDDTNSPKDCEFGGQRRARISSQCIKRAVRKHFEDKLPHFSKKNKAYRTKRLVEEVCKQLTEKGGEEVARASEALLAGLEIATDELK